MPGYKRSSRLQEEVNGRAPVATSLHASQHSLCMGAGNARDIFARVSGALVYNRFLWCLGPGNAREIVVNIFCSGKA